MEMMTLRDFWKTRKEREERFSTIVVVAGVKFCVIIYDLWSKSSHEVWISIEKKGSVENITLRIPEIHIKQKENLTDTINEVVEKVYQLHARTV